MFANSALCNGMESSDVESIKTVILSAVILSFHIVWLARRWGIFGKQECHEVKGTSWVLECETMNTACK